MNRLLCRGCKGTYSGASRLRQAINGTLLRRGYAGFCFWGLRPRLLGRFAASWLWCHEQSWAVYSGEGVRELTQALRAFAKLSIVHYSVEGIRVLTRALRALVMLSLVHYSVNGCCLRAFGAFGPDFSAASRPRRLRPLFGSLQVPSRFFGAF
jgi:hypothetical protein